MKTVFAVSHNTTLEGPIDYLCNYLKSQGVSIKRVIHPLDNYNNRESIILGSNGISKIKRGGNMMLNLLYDTVITTQTFLKDTKSTIYIGANSFDMLPGILVKLIFFFKAHRLIYFASDYSEDRFDNKVLNVIYSFLETIACKYSDLVISNTKRAALKRIKSHSLYEKKSLIIPNVASESFIPFKKKIKKTKYIYIGSINKEHGLLQYITKFGNNIHELHILGEGDELGDIVEYCKRSKIKLVNQGRQSHKAVLDYLTTFDGIGLAPYNLLSKYTYYASPLKVYEYIAHQIPVITTDVVEIARDIKKFHLGIVVSADTSMLDLKKLLNNFHFNNFSINSDKYIKKYNRRAYYKKIIHFI